MNLRFSLKSVLFGLLPLAMAIGCANSSEDRVLIRRAPEHNLFLAPKPLHFQISCANEKSCLPYAGAYVEYRPKGEGLYKVSRCTLALLSPRLVATNAHCVDPGSHDRFAVFPAT